MKSRVNGCLLITASIFLFACNIVKAETCIRVNQVGYPAESRKIAVIGSAHDLTGKTFSVINVRSGAGVYTDTVKPVAFEKSGDTPFAYNHHIDFSTVTTPGLYKLELEGCAASLPFKIGNKPYRHMIDLLLKFMRAARCGSTNPELHAPCHLHDATNVDLDVTGGWHDAGDYIKFSKKESYVTYLLLLSYAANEDYADHFSDINKNGLPDILDEARVGLNYLVKLYPDDNTFVYRVGDLNLDHQQGMRMPEADELAKTNRPALIGFDRNNLAKYAYTMALASTIFKPLPGFEQDADNYLKLAVKAYRKAVDIGDEHFDKLCLAATELFIATREENYLTDAKRFNDSLGKSDRGSYDTNINFAHARLAPYYENAAEKLRSSLSCMLATSDERVFGYTVKQFSWGSLYIALSGGTAAWMYHAMTQDPQYNEISRRIRDFALGVNSWGVCFISGTGTVYPINTHGNLPSMLKESGALPEMALPGSVALGPVDRSYWEKEWNQLIPGHDEDIYAAFQPKDCLYHDHSHDFVTNEPCIYGSAEAILFFSQFLRYGDNGSDFRLSSE